MGFEMDYPLVICYIANWKITMFRWGKLTIDGPFSVAMLVITRGQSGIAVLQQTQENIHEILCLLTPLRLKVQAPVLAFHPEGPFVGLRTSAPKALPAWSKRSRSRLVSSGAPGSRLRWWSPQDRLAKNHIPWKMPWYALGWWHHIDRKELPPSAIKLLSTCKWKMYTSNSDWILNPFWLEIVMFPPYQIEKKRWKMRL